MAQAPTAYRISVVFGLIVIALAVYGAVLPPVPVCGGLPANYATIIAFELARSAADLQAIFGTAPGACRTAIAARMDLINWIDSFAFIPAYGGFLIFFLLGLRERSPRLANIALVITIIACLADYAENTCLFHLSADPDASSPWLAALPWATGVKWVGLGVSAALTGLALAMRGGVNLIALIPCFISLVATVLAMIDPHRFGPFVSNGVTVGWLTVLVYAVAGAFRARKEPLAAE